MSDVDRLEAELSRLRPANPPEELMARLNDSFPKSRAPSKPVLHSDSATAGWVRYLRWLVPATAAAAMVISLLSWKSYSLKVVPAAQPQVRLTETDKGLKADKVEIEQQLLGSFEAVGHLADGEPVRLRCREWEDGVVLRDSRRGIEIEHRQPRLEVVRVSFETY